MAGAAWSSAIMNMIFGLSIPVPSFCPGLHEQANRMQNTDSTVIGVFIIIDFSLS
jgi:hypothetical protein